MIAIVILVVFIRHSCNDDFMIGYINLSVIQNGVWYLRHRDHRP